MPTADEEPVDPVTAAIARRLKAAKDASPYTVRSLANESGLGQSTIQRYLDGTRDMRVPDLYLLCRILGIDPVQLVDDAIADAEEGRG